MLASSGWDVIHVDDDLGLGTASDEEVMRIALESGRVIVTQDGDFHRMLATSGENQPSVIRLRFQSLELPHEVGPLIAAAATKHQDALHAGAIVTLDESESRVRPLPLNRDK